MLTACVAGGSGIARQAQTAGFHQAIAAGAGFRHVLFRARAPRDGEVLHVYLEGDGRAWLNPRRVATDPTPRHSLVLELMARDPAPAVMVGRPCYHGLAADPGCDARYWTHRRYSRAVVDSLAAVIEVVRRHENGSRSPVVLVGYSGGGTLAVLVAERIDDVAGVITIAANLDTAAWVDYHGFSPLAGSLNPAEQPPRDARFPSLHLVGGRDEEVLPAWTRGFAAARAGTAVRVVPDFDHRCCWAHIWPAPLDDLLKSATGPQGADPGHGGGGH